MKRPVDNEPNWYEAAYGFPTVTNTFSLKGTAEVSVDGSVQINGATIKPLFKRALEPIHPGLDSVPNFVSGD